MFFSAIKNFCPSRHAELPTAESPRGFAVNVHTHDRAAEWPLAHVRGQGGDLLDQLADQCLLERLEILSR
jgi:hypothetical protein